ncbi:hypothetical protein [Bowmanella pacifica]|uniref:High-affinity iron transporter n=1 Tax=Bowmanella pacifica TaxID=502051 RepID=A0A917YZP3_9ALTE|nr:hypothetical protein [Bowmanella pacifica]GGO70018.1 hypothetical protein GCM10010982_22530 [Bowmanella pacifica]
MLINSVILFLRDALPVFVLVSMLLAVANHSQRQINWLGWALALGLLGSLALTHAVDNLSELLEGAGVEVFIFSCQVAMFALLLVNLHCQFSLRPQGWRWSAIAMVSLVLAMDGANFLVYFFSYWTHEQTPLALIMGTILGGAVCMSVAVLLHILCRQWLAAGYKLPGALLMLMWGAGQLSYALNLLTQVDLLPPMTPIWDTSQWIADNSELGHLLNSLMGYEAAPGLWQLCVYLLAVVLPFSWLYRRVHPSRSPMAAKGEV